MCLSFEMERALRCVCLSRKILSVRENGLFCSLSAGGGERAASNELKVEEIVGYVTHSI